MLFLLLYVALLIPPPVEECWLQHKQIMGFTDAISTEGAWMGGNLLYRRYMWQSLNNFHNSNLRWATRIEHLQDAFQYRLNLGYFFRWH